MPRRTTLPANSTAIPNLLRARPADLVRTNVGWVWVEKRPAHVLERAVAFLRRKFRDEYRGAR